MSSIRIVDTSVLCNLLRVPNKDQDADRALREFSRAQTERDIFLLPIPVIYETGNHIAQSTNGAKRRIVAEAFVELVRKAFDGEIPFTPTPLQNPEDMIRWLDEFPDCATAGMGFGDLAITKVWEEQCGLNQGRRVLIWSYDRHLQGYDRHPRI
jgi:hypothetical protein